MILFNLQFVIIDNVKWSLYTTIISEKADLFSGEVPHNRDLSPYAKITSQVPELLIERSSILCTSNPVTVDKHFRESLVSKLSWGYLIELQHAPILQLLDDVVRFRTDRHKSHQSEIFHETAGLTFRSLSRTHHSPMSVMELTRLGQFTLL